LERGKIEDEYNQLMETISDLKDILANPKRIDETIYQELLEIADKYGDDRRTELQVGDVTSIEDEDLIDEEDVIITLTHNGYAKRLATSEFKSQHRGGRGVQGTGVHDDDFVEHLVSTSTHDTLLFFTNLGKVYRMKGYEVPEYGRNAKGIPVINLLGVESGEKVQAVINVRGDAKESKDFLFFTTLKGVVKRTPVSDFGNIRTNGLKALNLHDEDQLMNVQITDGTQNIIIATHTGYAVSFAEEAVRQMGRSASGVRGIRLRDDDFVIGAGILAPDHKVLVITENGYGKQTPVSEYPIKGRGGKGIKTANITEKNGPLAGMSIVDGTEDIMLTTDKGVMIRFGAETVSETGRATLGVRVIRIEEGSKVATLAKVDKEVDEPEEVDGEATATDAPVQAEVEVADVQAFADELVAENEADTDEE
jgi:DNA gyrase subunit A